MFLSVEYKSNFIYPIFHSDSIVVVMVAIVVSVEVLVVLALEGGGWGGAKTNVLSPYRTEQKGRLSQFVIYRESNVDDI